jgi:molybdopterin converting factor small subunit
MALTVSLPSVLARLADGNRSLTALGTTVGEAVTDLTQRFPSLATRLVDDAGQPYPFITYYLNDEDIRFAGGFGATVSDGDELTIVSAVAGG